MSKLEQDWQIEVRVACAEDLVHVPMICWQIADSAKERGTGIAKRSPEYLGSKISQGRAVIAVARRELSPRSVETVLAGFCYVETWSHNKYVANSGLIVFPQFRNRGLAQKIKERAFKLSRDSFPEAKLFGLTTSLPVMTINSGLGYRPVTFSQLTDDQGFWQGCEGCVNFQILESKNHKNCLCTAMLYDPEKEKTKK